MPVERWSERVVVVRLADDPQLSDELDSLHELLQQERLDAVLDFSAVRFVNSSNFARLLKLRRLMVNGDRRLVLCGLNTQVWGGFLLTNLDKVFQFSDNVALALATLQMKKDADPKGTP